MLKEAEKQLIEKLSSDEDFNHTGLVVLAIVSPCLIVAFVGGLLLCLVSLYSFCSTSYYIIRICCESDENEINEATETELQINQISELEEEGEEEIEEIQSSSEMLLAGELV